MRTTTVSQFHSLRPFHSALLFLLIALPFRASCAAVCNPTDFQGTYGFQLSGQTNISGVSKPVVSLGRIVLTAEGGIEGSATVMFSGLLLGNPVTGTYEAHSDCTVSWSLQDDSGAFQHFSGMAAPGARTVDFRQTDPGGVERGVMARIAATCTTTTLQRRYNFTLEGASTPMLPGETARTLSRKGVLHSDQNGHFKVSSAGDKAEETDATVGIDDQCMVDMQLTLPDSSTGTNAPIHLRGILVDEGRRILAIATDAGVMASTAFVAPAAGMDPSVPLVP